MQHDDLFHLAFDSNPEAQIITRVNDGMIVDVNRAFLEFTGFDRSEVIGKLSMDVPFWFDPIDRHHLATLLRTNGNVIGFKARFRLKNNVSFNGMMTAAVFKYRDEIHTIATVRSINNVRLVDGAIKGNEARLNMALQELRDTLDALPDLLLEVDTQGTIFNYHTPAPSYLPQRGRSAVNLNIRDLFPAEAVQVMSDAVESARREGRHRGSVYSLDDSGQTRWFELSIATKSGDYQLPRFIVLCRDISERKQAEEELALSQKKFETVFHQSPDPMIIATLNGAKIVELNQAYADSAGYPKEYIYGKTTHEIIGFAYDSHREKMIEDLKKHGMISNMEVTFKKRDGRLVDALISARICVIKGLPYIVAMTKDIQMLRDAQAALKESERLYRLISENSRDIILVCDHTKRIVYASPSVKKILGYDNDESIGQLLMSFISPTDSQELLKHNLNNYVREFSDASMQSRARKKDGSFVWLETLISPLLDEQGLISGFQAVSRDISERKRAEEALLHLAAGVAHNFNNVLMATISNAQAAQGMLGDASGNVQRIATLLDNVVQASLGGRDVVQRLSRIVGTQQKMLAETDILDLGQLLGSLPGTIEGLHLVRQQGPIALKLKLGQGLFVRAVAGELLEVFLNLSTNAADAMPEGGVLEVEAKGEGHQVVITFKDQGKGADPATLARFFDPFFSTKGSQGKGLGLSLSRAIIAAHGGRLTASSQPGQGTTLTIQLPLSIIPPLPQAPQHSPVSSPNLTILLVEDEGLVAMGLAFILEAAGHQVVQASSLAEAAYKLTTHAPDLAICDLGLPDKKGMEVCYLLEQRALDLGLGKMPIVVLSGWDEKQSEAMGQLDWKPWAYLQKPVGKEQLIKVIDEVMRKSQP